MGGLMDQVSEMYSVDAVKVISKGYVPGGLMKLKKEFPEAYRDMEIKLERNFTQDGVDRYVKDLIFGLKKINQWREG
jgi:hypothetical protein